MTTLGLSGRALWGAATGHPIGLFVCLLGCLALLQMATGLARSRQWPLLPLVFGLTALAAFLLNPLADAQASQQLRLALARQDVLTSLAILQMVLAATGMGCSLRLLSGRGEGLWTPLLGVLHTLPAPLLIVALLLWQQAWLESFVGARPEVVGRTVGLLAATVLSLLAVLAMRLPTRLLFGLHTLLSGLVVLACMFVPVLPLPLPMTQAVPAAGEPTATVLGALAACLGLLAWVWGFRRGSPICRTRAGFVQRGWQ